MDSTISKITRSDLIISNNFLKSYKKYANKLDEHIENIKNKLKVYGKEVVTTKKGTKRLTNVNVFEIRSRIQGHRILYKYGYQLKNKFPELNDDDIIFCKYVSEHDEIGNDAESLEDEELEIDEEYLLKYDSEEKDEQEDKVDKIYYYKNNNFIPVLDKEQVEILESKDDYVIVDGVAGSGKTSLCLRKIIKECEENIYKSNKTNILYTTFSNSLLSHTKNSISLYINKIEDSDDLSNKKELINELGKVRCLQLLDIYGPDCKFKVVNFDKFYEIYNDEANTDYFTYDLKNKLTKTGISLETVFKETEGVILGMDLINTQERLLSFEDFKSKRENVFNEKQLKIIYDIAKKYSEFLDNSTEYLDKNYVASKILEDNTFEGRYDLSILDEAQDFTQKELKAFKHLSKKMFIVADPLQMINPAYFELKYVKELLPENRQGFTLISNYRNTSDINSALNTLIKINKEKLGNHKDAVKNMKSCDSDESSTLFYTNSEELFNKLNRSEFDSYCIVVPTKEEKKLHVNKKEILTVSEIKGLERETIVLYNMLSKYKEIWEKLQFEDINKKQADENTLERYYFNIFYVALTRAQRNILILENENIEMFKNFFKRLEFLESDTPVEYVIDKFKITIYTDEDRINKINEAINVDNYENADFHAERIKDNIEKEKQQNRISIYKRLRDGYDYIKLLEECITKGIVNDAVVILNKKDKRNIARIIEKVIKKETIDYKEKFKIYIEVESKVIKDYIFNYSKNDISNKIDKLNEKLKEKITWI